MAKAIDQALMNRDAFESGGALLLGEIAYVRSRLASSTGAAERPAIVRALLEAIDSHARVRRLAAQLLGGEDLVTVNAQLQELWAQIQARSADGPLSVTPPPASDEARAPASELEAQACS